MNMHVPNASTQTFEEFQNEVACIQDDISDTCEGYGNAEIVCGVTEFLVEVLNTMQPGVAVFTYLDVIARLTKAAAELEGW